MTKLMNPQDPHEPVQVSNYKRMKHFMQRHCKGVATCHYELRESTYRSRQRKYKPWCRNCYAYSKVIAASSSKHERLSFFRIAMRTCEESLRHRQDRTI